MTDQHGMPSSQRAVGSSAAQTSRRPRWQLRDEAASYVRSLILSGQLAPDTFVRLGPIAVELGMSVTPVREALMSLREQGFLELSPNRGFKVCRFTLKDVADSFLILGFVGGELAARAASLATPESLQEIRRVEGQFRGMVEIGDGHRSERANNKFHGLINNAAASPRLSWFYASAIPIARHFYSLVPGWTEASQADHALIVERLSARDPEGSRAAMSEHLRHVSELLQRHLASSRWPELADAGTDMEQKVKGSVWVGGLPLGLEQRMAQGSDGGSD